MPHNQSDRIESPQSAPQHSQLGRMCVLVTAYNGERFIEDQLLSIMHQTLPVDEVLICDDGSSDNTPRLVLEFLSCHDLNNWSFVVNEKNLGPAANVLSHLVNLKGDLVFLADQDDIWEPDKVEVMTRYMRRNPDCVLVVSRSALIDGSGRPIRDRAFQRIGGVLQLSRAMRTRRVRELGLDDFVGYSTIPLHAMSVRSNVVRLVADTSEWPELSRSLGADWYIGILASILGNCALIPDKLVRRRVHDTNISLGRLRKTTALASTPTNRLLMLTEARQAHESLLHNSTLAPLITPEQRRLLRLMIGFLWERIAFSEEPSVLKGVRLLGHVPLYLRSAGRLSRASRMWIADVMYAYGINWKLHGRRIRV